MISKHWKIGAPLLPHAGRRAILIPYRQTFRSFRHGPPLKHLDNPGGVAIRPPNHQLFAIRRMDHVYGPARGVETTLSSDHWPLPDDLPAIERLLDSNSLEGATAFNTWRRITRDGPTHHNAFGWSIPVKTEMPKIRGWLNAHNYRDHYRVRP